MNLINAVIEGNLDKIKKFVEQGADIHAYKNCALRWASEEGHLDVVKFLVEQGADIHADDDYTIRVASLYGHLDIVKYLKRVIKLRNISVKIV
jgi:ankyrin repeat protein